MTSDSTALSTLEQRVRSLVSTHIGALTTGLGAYLAATIHDTHAASATEILSTPAVHAALTTALTGTHTQVDATIRASSRAASALAYAQIANDLGDTTPDDDLLGPALAVILAALLTDVDNAFATALIDIQTTITAAYAAVTIGPAGTLAAARTLTTNQALHRAARRLGVRVTAAAVVAVHRSFTDAQLALYTAHQNSHPDLRYIKRWEVRAFDPCPSCAALHGVTLALDQEFDPAASTDPHFRPPRPYRALTGPPRHPNCRCRLVILATPASARLHTTITAHPPVTTTYLTAADIRRMSSDRYRALFAFLTSALRTTTRLIRKIRAGG